MPDDAEFFRKQPRQSRSRQVVDSILEAVDEFFTRNDEPDSLSLQGIARRAGVGIGSLYDYFANREGLLGAFLNRVTAANFARLEADLGAANGRTFDETLPLMVDAVLKVYLEQPRRTRGVVLTIGRLGWIGPVVRERDRFAHVIADRLRALHPELPEARTRLVAEVLCDCVIGVVVGEVWRDRDPRTRAEVREELVTLVVQRVAALLVMARGEAPASLNAE